MFFVGCNGLCRSGEEGIVEDYVVGAFVYSMYDPGVVRSCGKGVAYWFQKSVCVPC